MGNRVAVGAEVFAPGCGIADGQMSLRDVTFDANLVANVFRDLAGAPALHAGDVELGKSASSHLVMIAAEKPTAQAAHAASVWVRQRRIFQPGWPSQVLDGGGG